MDEQSKQIADILYRLKGVLLLSSSGVIYLLRDYEYEQNVPVEVEKKGWHLFWGVTSKTTQEVHSYVSSISLSHLKGELVYSYNDRVKLVNKVNELIDDRSRYLTLQKTLKNIGAIITTRK